MSDTNETIADIIREMREQANEPTIESLGEVFPPVGVEDVKDWADRIEEAAARERVPGNTAAMREALDAVREAFDSNDFGAMGDHPSSDVLDMADAVRRKVDAALAATASPRPWRVNGHSIEANDPDGLWLQNKKTGWGVVANLPSCPKSRMSKKNRETWDAIVEANAALIVAAVNLHEHLIEHNKLNAEKLRERSREVRRCAEIAAFMGDDGLASEELYAFADELKELAKAKEADKCER